MSVLNNIYAQHFVSELIFPDHQLVDLLFKFIGLHTLCPQKNGPPPEHV